MRTDRVQELVEHRSSVVRTRCGLGVILNGEDRFLAMTEPFDRSIVEIDVSHLQLGRAGNSLCAPDNGEPMVLRCDEHFAGRHFLDGMISAVMAKAHLLGACAEREAQDLMSQADTENRHASISNRTHGVRRVGHGCWIAWAVREEDAVRRKRERLFSCRLGGNDSTVVLRKEPQDVSLDAEIVRDNVVRRVRISPCVRLFRRHT